jgi:hypothetical protein
MVGGCDERRVAAAGDNIDRGGSNVCALLYSTPTMLGEASKIWEVRRKSAGSQQEVGRKSAGTFFSVVTRLVVIIAKPCSK